MAGTTRLRFGFRVGFRVGFLVAGDRRRSEAQGVYAPVVLVAHPEALYTPINLAVLREEGCSCAVPSHRHDGEVAPVVVSSNEAPTVVEMGSAVLVAQAKVVADLMGNDQSAPAPVFKGPREAVATLAGVLEALPMAVLGRTRGLPITA